MINFEKTKINIKNKYAEYKKILLTKFEQYRAFFDEKLNTTITIGIIGLLLLSVGSIFYSSKLNLKSNLLESEQKGEIINTLPEDLLVTKQAIITIGGEKYLLKLEKLEDIQELRY